jgi:predicted aspartyl protease
MRSSICAALVALLPALSACGGDDGLRFEGSVGQPRALLFAGDAPLASTTVTLPGSSPQPVALLLDTGAPATVLSTHAFANAPAGWPTATLEALGLTLPERVVGMAPLFSNSPCDPAPAGVLGGDVLAHFRVELDYGRRQLILDGPPIAADTELPLSLAGGGRLRFGPNDPGHRVGATRQLVEVEIEGLRATALIDTGASLTVLSEQLFAKLAPAGRPTACCQRFATGSGLVTASLSRVKSLRLGTVELEDMPITVMPDAALFAPVSAEVGRPVELLLGGSALRELRLVLAPREGRLAIARVSANQVDADEWRRPGFGYCRDNAGVAHIIDIYEGTDAETKLRGGDRVVAVAGQSVDTLDDAALAAALRAPGVGNTVQLRIQGASSQRDEEVRVEDVLPSFR